MITPNPLIRHRETYCYFSYYMLKSIYYLQFMNVVVTLVDILATISMLLQVRENECEGNFINERFDLFNLILGFTNTHLQNIVIFVFQTLEWKAINYVLESEKDLKVEEITFHINNDERQSSVNSS